MERSEAQSKDLLFSPEQHASTRGMGATSAPQGGILSELAGSTPASSGVSHGSVEDRGIFHAADEFHLVLAHPSQQHALQMVDLSEAGIQWQLRFVRPRTVPGNSVQHAGLVVDDDAAAGDYIDTIHAYLQL